MKRKFLILTLVFMLSVNVVFGAQIYKTINVLMNDVQVYVNGSKVSSDNFLYNGTTYVPLKTVSNMFGAQVSWDSKTRNISISTDVETTEPIKISKIINAYEPTFSLSELGMSNIEAVSVSSEGNITSVQFNIKDDKFVLSSLKSIYGGYTLNINTNYTMKLYSSTESRTIEFKTGDLRTIKQQENNATVYFIPAMPSKGFNWPYLLRIPGKNEPRSEYASSLGKTLMIETANFGTVNTYSQFESALPQLYTGYLSGQYYSVDISSALNLPSILPIIPRYNAYFRDGDFTNYLYTHSFDRDTAIFKELLKNPIINNELANQFSSSGATLDDMVLPTASYKGKNLVFPIGIYDYKSITGKDFNLTSFNQVARLIHMGSSDENNTLYYSDCYGEDERVLIKSLFAEDVKTRANQLISAYKEVGGKGMFILDQGVGHSMSDSMREYLVSFFASNLTGTAPVYNLPKDTKQLVYTLYK